jgi:hypothetical protein
MTYFEKFSRRFFSKIEKLLLNQNRVFNGIAERLKNQATKDVIKFTLDSLRPEIVKIFDEARQETAKEKKKELSDLDKTRQFLREVCNLEDKNIKQTHYKDTDVHEIVVDTTDSESPDYVVGFVFDKNKKFNDVRIVSME